MPGPDGGIDVLKELGRARHHSISCFTVCDNAAKEVCPVWPGPPISVHWGIADPAAVRGTVEAVERAFREAYFLLDRRISLFLSLPLSTLDAMALSKELNDIGRQSLASVPEE